ncbi:MutS 5 [Micromonas commoda]|uniref:MutS 5 n=1 Tax=Micromonas commoda (strain RCC299 / NOUM17 / CCMP2709) TaxID=296587 RepID=C1EEU6_MICCC|nr:MutS 5 [Micromonas commoda]ACO66300.1 MutS 5 [Micromonas commoda]|eukprot:XP_002505042.1 MutS 5 [Micromonas commoda]
MPPRVDPTGRRAATADADADDAGDGRDPAVDSARVFMSFVADASRFGAAVYDRDANAIETVEGYLDDDLVLLRLLLVSHEPDVVFVPIRVVGTKDGGSRRANAILDALTERGSTADDDDDREGNRAEHDDDDDDDDDRAEEGRRAPRRADEDGSRLRRAIVPLPAHAFDRIDACVGAIREACALPDDAAVNARVALDAPLQVAAAGALCAALLARDVVLTKNRTRQRRGSNVGPNGGDDGEEEEDKRAAHGVRVDLGGTGGGGSWRTGTHSTHDPADIREMSLGGYLRIDDAARVALGIERLESHPSQYVGCGKEWGLFALAADACVTPAGRRTVRNWFRRPTLNLQSLNDRLDGVEYFKDNPGVRDDMRAIARRGRDAHAVLASMSARVDKATRGVGEWRRLHAFLRSARDLLEYVEERFVTLRAGEDFANAGAHANTGGFPAASTYVPSVRSGVCVDLDDAREMYRRLPDLLEKVRETIVREIPRVLRGRGVEDNLSVVYLPKTGFMLRCVGRALPPDIADELGECEFAFDKSSDEPELALAADFPLGPEGIQSSRYSAYYFTAATRELSDAVGDVLSDVHDLEASILRDLRRRVLSNSRLLRDVASCVAEMDATMSLAAFTSSGNMRRPILHDGTEMNVVGARHPLQEATRAPECGAIVPNDFRCGGGRIAVVTGPNQSGKSVYLKSIAACVFLAHVGSFVPAESAFIPLVDRVFTRVGASRDGGGGGGGGGGSFAADCARVSQMCNGCTGRSLCVVDEFGKGTATADGVGLLAGFLRYLARSPTPPIALVATHFTEFVRDESIVPTTMRPMQFLTMRIHLRSPPGYRSAGEDDSVVFLYRAVPGVSSRAYSLRCARDAGLPGSVLARCEELAAIDAANGAGVGGERGTNTAVVRLAPAAGAKAARARGAARDRAVVAALAGLDPTCSFEDARAAIAEVTRRDV